MNKRNEIFIPLLKEYTKNNYDSIIRSKYPWAPFIPYSFAEYGNSKPSVFISELILIIGVLNPRI